MRDSSTMHEIAVASDPPHGLPTWALLCPGHVCTSAGVRADPPSSFGSCGSTRSSATNRSNSLHSFRLASCAWRNTAGFCCCGVSGTREAGGAQQQSSRIHLRQARSTALLRKQ